MNELYMSLRFLIVWDRSSFHRSYQNLVYKEIYLITNHSLSTSFPLPPITERGRGMVDSPLQTWPIEVVNCRVRRWHIVMLIVRVQTLVKVGKFSTQR